MTHKLTIAGLDDFEAEHIGQILSAYRGKILFDKLTAMARKEDNAVEWYDAHLEWHTTIMEKISWSKE